MYVYLTLRYSWDVTAATWGGSTAHTMESEGMSMYSTEDFDTTKETASQQEEEVEHGAVHPQRYTGRRYTYEVQGHMPKGPGGKEFFTYLFTVFVGLCT